MADIDIVPKHKSYLWLWIVIALIVVAVLWYALAGGSRPARVGDLGTAAPMVAEAVVLQTGGVAA